MLHSPRMPKWRIARNAMPRNVKYSLSLSVWDGATTIDSPVWIPRGSTFSMLHTVMQLSAWSRTTSYSTSFQPVRSSSISTCGEEANASASMRLSSASPWAIPEPRPPSVKPVRIMTG